jgi:hypothetical protein
MDKHWDLAMREDLDRLATEDDRGNAMAAVRGHDNCPRYARFLALPRFS